MAKQLDLLKTKRFLPLFITQFFGAFNDNAFKNAFLIWFTYDIASFHGIDAPMMVSIGAGLFILPFLLFSAMAGQLVDKFEKSFITKIIKLVEIVLMIAMALSFYFKSIEGLLALLFMMGIQSTFFGPIKYSLLPEHLKDNELISGNAFIEGGTFLSILFGTIFGGLVIRTSFGVEILSIAVIFFAVIGWVSSLSIPKSIIGDPKIKIGWNIFKETIKIISFAREERTVWLSIIGISWFWLIGATFLTQFPTYTNEIIGGQEDIVTFFLTIFSIGVGVGSLWCNKLLKGEINGRLVPYGCIAITCSILLFTLASKLYTAPDISNGATYLSLVGFFQTGYAAWLIILSLLLLSISSGIYIVPLYAIMQHRSNHQYLARIIATNNILNALFMVLASLYAIGIFALDFSVIDLLLSVGLVNIGVYYIVRGIVKRRLNNVQSDS